MGFVDAIDGGNVFRRDRGVGVILRIAVGAVEEQIDRDPKSSGVLGADVAADLLEPRHGRRFSARAKPRPSACARARRAMRYAPRGSGEIRTPALARSPQARTETRSLAFRCPRAP